MRNSSNKSKDKSQKSWAKRRRRLMLAQSQSSRRGVLLLVVLSMLVLFMLVGTAFLMSSSQTKKAMHDAAKQDRNGNYATELLNRAMLQLVRDTDNPNSVIHYHSLLRDLYGTDGFQGVTQAPTDLDFSKAEGQATRYAGAIKDDTATAAVREDLGPTNGQFIDIYVSQQAYVANSLKTLAHVLKLDRDSYGQSDIYPLPLTKGYFNGCLLTITNGPAAGQSARILDYEFIPSTLSAPTTRTFRFRVMAFQRSDGQPLRTDAPAITKSRNPELTELAGATFMVNGRAFSGTGVGYNQLSATGQPRLSALQLFQVGSGTYIGAELALLPNSAYFDPVRTPVGAAPPTLAPPGDPFLQTPVAIGQLSSGQFQLLNVVSATPTLQNPGSFLYPNYVGAGGPNEGYDAADFQNMFLALQTVTPRSQGRVIHSPATLQPLEVTDPDVLTKSSDFLRLDLENVPLPSFHRPDLVNFWNHRLLQYLTNAPTSMNPDDAVRAIVQPYSDDKFTLNPAANGLTAANAALISAIKRQSILRPTREDHPHFDGSNPMSLPPNLSSVTPLATGGNFMIPTWEVVGPWDVDNDNDGVRDSVWVDLGDPIQQTEDGRRYKPLYAILCIDLDSRLNVNAHGLADDLHLPYYDVNSKLEPPLVGIIETPAGSGKYTAVAGSLESGLVKQLSGGAYTPQPLTAFVPGPNLAGSSTSQPVSSQRVARGLGYGPAEISLRPVFPIPWIDNIGTLDLRGNRSELVGGPVDSYKALLVGRERRDAAAVSGRYGYEPQGLVKPNSAITPGDNYQFAPDNATTPTVDQRVPDLATQIKHFDYPWRRDYLSAFGTAPDLFGRYGVAIDFGGQPFYEGWYDRNPNDKNPSTSQLYPSLLTDVPYELDLSSSQRRDSWASKTNSFGNLASAASSFNTSLSQNDDSPYSPTDLEKVLRGWDPESGALPSRLWDAVNDFDPLKLKEFDPHRIEGVASASFGSIGEPALLAAAQQLAGINRRLVTTDSYSLPVPSQGMPDWVRESAAALIPLLPPADLQKLAPGITTPNGEDIFRGLTGKPYSSATLVDLLAYRFQQGRLVKNGLYVATTKPNGAYNTNAPLEKALLEQAVGQLAYELLAPDVIAGQRMDINRPFGDGKDNNSDGVVDDPLEAGDPFLDTNGNGKWDAGEPFLDMDGNGVYSPPSDKIWANLTSATGPISEPIEFDYTNGQFVPVYKSTIAGGVRNLESQGRQLFARQLYCLMLLLVDENYVAPWDEYDPQIMTWMTAQKKLISTALQAAPFSFSAAVADPQAGFIVGRKLTCRQIAQWAINVVDARDSDVIATSFEYDENPWDGWGVPDQDGFNIPLDGDVATNENLGEIIDWSKVPQGRSTSSTADDNSRVIAPSAATPVPVLPAVNSIVPTAKLPLVPNQTRAVVWGVENGELSISETLAYHDRRTEDKPGADSSGLSGKTHGTFVDTETKVPQHYPDFDLDQGLRPRGSLFVELHNNSSSDAQQPAEVYSKLDVDTNYVPTFPANTFEAPGAQGIRLNRLSNYGVDSNGKLSRGATNVRRSPVWKMIVVEEDPAIRSWEYPSDDDWLAANKVGWDINLKKPPTPIVGEPPQTPSPRDVSFSAVSNDKWNLPVTGVALTDKDNRDAANAVYGSLPTKVQAWRPSKALPIPLFRPADPDFEEGFSDGFKPILKDGKANRYTVKFPYVEREFYFTTDNSTSREVVINTGNDLAFDPNFKLRIPDRTIFPLNAQFPPNYLKQNGIDQNTDPFQTQRFIPSMTSNGNLIDVPIAPILPGRYAVVGSAGTRYTDASTPVNNMDTIKIIPSLTVPRFMNPIGRTPSFDNANPNTDDGSLAILRPDKVRRIEMWPCERTDLNQFVVATNGGFDLTTAPTLPGFVREGDKQYVARGRLSVEIGRSNEVIKNGNAFQSVYDSKAFQPCVAIPIEGMSASEPAWGWSSREYEAALIENERRIKNGGSPSTSLYHGFIYTYACGEGRYFDAGGLGTSQYYFDVPFDSAPELVRTGTTSNYRTVHLQRLANPLLPWNPPPGKYFTKRRDPATTPPQMVDVDMHQPNLPINTYRTVDSSSVDLTAFNGVSRSESKYPTVGNPQPGREKQNALAQFRPWDPKDSYTSGEQYNLLKTMDDGRQIFQFKSLERGAYSQLSATHRISNYTAPTTVSGTIPPLVQRLFAANESAVGWMGDLNQIQNPGFSGLRPYKGIRDGRITTMKASDVQSSVRTSLNIPATSSAEPANHMDMVLEHSLGFGNESFGKLFMRQSTDPAVQAPTYSAIGTPSRTRLLDADGIPVKDPSLNDVYVESTYPWVAFNNRPFVSAEEIMQVPMASSAQLFRQYSAIASTVDPINPPVGAADSSVPRNPYGLDALGSATAATNATRLAAMQAPFGHLANMFAASAFVAGVKYDTSGNLQPYGAPNFNRILEYIQVPSRYVGTETVLNAETFNDVPNVDDSVNTPGTAMGSNIVNSATAIDPRYFFQPPFNKVSRQRDPGRVNLNTVTGQHVGPPGAAKIWSDVFDGIMHRKQDGNIVDSSGNLIQLGHFGPAWRDVVLSRRGYAQFDATSASVDKVVVVPDTYQFGLNNNFPTFFANPFRSPDAGDLVPVMQMVQQSGVDASMERVHPRNRGYIYDAALKPIGYETKWGNPASPIYGDARDAGFGNDYISYNSNAYGAIPNIAPTLPTPFQPLPAAQPPDPPTYRDTLPLFSELRSQPFVDTDRNSYMMYEPMSRLGNLVTNRSGVYAVWITVGYFEVEPAPKADMSRPTDWGNKPLYDHFGGDINLYNRAYPDGYMLGKELNSETGDVKRPRGFYIIDRTEEVGFKPGEDLNVEKAIRLRRRIE